MHDEGRFCPAQRQRRGHRRRDGARRRATARRAGHRRPGREAHRRGRPGDRQRRGRAAHGRGGDGRPGRGRAGRRPRFREVAFRGRGPLLATGARLPRQPVCRLEPLDGRLLRHGLRPGARRWRASSRSSRRSPTGSRPTRAVLVLERAEPPPADVVAKVAERDRRARRRADLPLCADAEPRRHGADRRPRRSRWRCTRPTTSAFRWSTSSTASARRRFPPPHPDFLDAMGRTNDAIIYGGRVQLFVRGPADAGARRWPKNCRAAPRATTASRSREIFQAFDGDFYAIDPLLFSPAEVIVTAIDSGDTFRAGAPRPRNARNRACAELAAGALTSRASSSSMTARRPAAAACRLRSAPQRGRSHASARRARLRRHAAPRAIAIPGFGDALPDAVLVRAVAAGTFEAVTRRLGVLHALAQLGGPGLERACGDRALRRQVDDQLSAARAGLPTPPTFAVEGRAAAEAVARRELAAGPLVLKPLFGAQGRGIRLVALPRRPARRGRGRPASTTCSVMSSGAARPSATSASSSVPAAWSP